MLFATRKDFRYPYQSQIQDYIMQMCSDQCLGKQSLLMLLFYRMEIFEIPKYYLPGNLFFELNENYKVYYLLLISYETQID